MAPKQKGQKMALGEFLTDNSLGSWADEMEDMPMPAGGRPSYGGDARASSGWGSGGDRGPREDRGDRGYPPREQLPLPTKPPYTVHLGNLSFDATEPDLQSLFSGCDVTSIRLVEDKLDRKPKGFGYAEFATLDGIKRALDLNGSQFQGRSIRISVAEPQKDRQDTRDFDWNAKRGPLPPAEPSRQPGGGSFRGQRPEFGSEAPRRSNFGGDDGRERDFSNWERKGPLTPVLPQAAPAGRGEGPRERKNSPAWGEGRTTEGSRPPRREFSDRPAPERAPTAAELDNQWRNKMRPDPPTPTIPDASVTTSPQQTPATPASEKPPALATRPKLNLQKRTVSQAEPSPALPTGGSDAKASPFGAARAVDTAQREREVEEKAKQRREEEAKAREEKRAADEKAKEARRAAKDSERQDKPKGRPNGQAKEASEGQEAASRNYQILRHEAGEGDDQAGDHEPTGASVSPDTDKNVKPQEIVRDANGEADPTAQQLEEEGWSTVSKTVKGRKAPRALAS